MALTSYSSARSQRVAIAAPAPPSTTPIAASRIPSTSTSPKRSPLGTERHADAHLAAPLGHQVRHDTIDAKGREQHGRQGEGRQ